MNAGVIRLHAPGTAWLPAVWRQRRTWRTVGRFAWLGPLVGGAPYLIFVITVPFAFAIGLLPACIAGVAFASWYHAGGRRTPTWPWRAAVGAFSGGLATAAVALGCLWWSVEPDFFPALVVALHGVPAAVVLALTQRPDAA